MRTLIACALLASACADSTAAGSLNGASSTEVTRGVTQGGAQDIARFRAVVQQGAIPAPSTLSDTGFLAEHALDLPPATCGESVCLNPMLAVAPRFDGGNWTMAFVALSTRVDPAARPRRPLHLIAVLEDSSPVLGDEGVRAELSRLFGVLQPDDRVSLVEVGARAETRLRGVTPEVARAWRADTAVDPGVALYEGLAAARSLARAVDGADARVLLLTTGRNTAGVTDEARVVALGEALAREGVGISVVGLGADFQSRVPEALGSLGAGTYAYAEDRADLGDILQREGQTTLYGHASALLVEVGDQVAAGTPIAKVGSTGHSTGPHLHFEVRKHGRAQDPSGPLGLDAQ
jgi:Ca-activated chloride channel family protein